MKMLTSPLDGGEWSASLPRKRPQYSLDRRLGRPTDGLNALEKKNLSVLQKLKRISQLASRNHHIRTQAQWALTGRDSKWVPPNTNQSFRF